MENVKRYSVKVSLDDLREDLKSGLHTDAICKKHGISRQGLHDRCKRHGLADLLRANRKPVIVKPTKTHFLVKGWLLEKAAYKELIRLGAVKAYHSQKTMASWRNIPWEISFKEWWEVWQESGKWSQRGRTKGCYVMARYNDIGPYKVGNVVIQTHGENAKTAQSHAKRDRAPEAKGVFLLYPNAKKPWVARAKTKHLGYFETEGEAIEARKKALQEA